MSRDPRRTPPGGSAVDRLSDLVERSITALSADVQRVQDRVEASEARTGKDLYDLLSEMRRENSHINDRMTRFHEAAQAGIAQVREELREHEKAAAEGAARGAAEGATRAAGEVAQSVAVVAAKTAGRGFLTTWQGKVLAASSGFTALIVALGNIPDFVRGWNAVWTFLGGQK